MRGLREETQHDYIRFVSDFAAFLGCAPDTSSIRPRAAADHLLFKAASETMLTIAADSDATSCRSRAARREARLAQR